MKEVLKDMENGKRRSNAVLFEVRRTEQQKNLTQDIVSN